MRGKKIQQGQFLSMWQPLLWVCLLLCGSALAQVTPAGGAAPQGLANFVEFSKLIPSMNTLTGDIMSIISAMDIAGVADTLARLIAGSLALGVFGIAAANYAWAKRINVFGIDGSFNNMLLAGLTVLMIVVGVPRIVGDISWAMWNKAYNEVSTRVNPAIDNEIRSKTAVLAETASAFIVANIAAGLAPIAQAKDFSDRASAGQFGQPAPTPDVGTVALNDAMSNAAEAKKANNDFASKWQIGALLVMGIFISYIGVVFGSALFVIFMSIFMPVAFAFLPVNSGLIVKALGGIVSSTLVAAVAPGLMLANIAIIFDGPVAYLIQMMQVTKSSADAVSTALAASMNSCTQGISDTVSNLTFGLTDNTVGGQVGGPICALTSGFMPAITSIGQAAAYLTVGLIVTAMIFIGLSGFAMLIFKEFKAVVDAVLTSGGSLGNGGGASAATSFARNVSNRIAGAAIATAGVLTGNAALAGAGTRSVASGQNAIGNTLGAAFSGSTASKIMNRKGKDDPRKKENTPRQTGGNNDPRKAGSGGENAQKKNGGAENANPGQS